MTSKKYTDKVIELLPLACTHGKSQPSECTKCLNCAVTRRKPQLMKFLPLDLSSRADLTVADVLHLMPESSDREREAVIVCRYAKSLQSQYAKARARKTAAPDTRRPLSSAELELLPTSCAHANGAPAAPAAPADCNACYKLAITKYYNKRKVEMHCLLPPAIRASDETPVLADILQHVNNVQFDALAAISYHKQLVKDRNKPTSDRKRAYTAILDKKRSDKERKVRAKVSRGEELTPDDIKVTERIANRNKSMSNVHVMTEEKIAAKTIQLVANSSTPVTYEEMEAKVSATNGLTNSERYTKLGTLDDKKKARNNELARKPRRKIKKKQYAAMHPRKPNVDQTKDFTLAQRLEAKEASRQHRADGYVSPRPDNQVAKWIRRLNDDKDQFADEHLLDQLNCDPKLFLERLFELGCAFCGSDEAMGLDRLDSGKRYVLGNVVQCCMTCNYSKNTLLPAAFVAKATEIHEYTATHGFPGLDALTGDDGECAYCGADDVSSIDRLDPRGEYVENNVVACCAPCNYFKKQESVQHMQARVGRIAFKSQNDQLVPDFSTTVDRILDEARKAQANEQPAMRVVAKPRAEFQPTRDADQNMGVRVGSTNRIYHTPACHTAFLCLRDGKVNEDGSLTIFTKDFKQPVFTETCESMIERGYRPCKVCRASVTQLEFEMLSDTSRVPSRHNLGPTSHASVMSVVLSTWHTRHVIDENAVLPDMVWAHNDDAFYHNDASCPRNICASIASGDRIGVPCLMCAHVVQSANDVPEYDVLKRARSLMTNKWKVAARQQARPVKIAHKKVKELPIFTAPAPPGPLAIGDVLLCDASASRKQCAKRYFVDAGHVDPTVVFSHTSDCFYHTQPECARNPYGGASTSTSFTRAVADGKFGCLKCAGILSSSTLAPGVNVLSAMTNHMSRVWKRAH